MIKFGIAGIPISSKYRDLKSGIKYLAELDLSAMEIQISHVREFESITEPEKFSKFAEEIKSTSLEKGVELYVHAPYYIDLVKNAEDGIKNLMKSIDISSAIGAKILLTQLGIGSKKDLKKVIGGIRKVVEYNKNMNYELKLGIETAGKKELFGSVDEVVKICNQIEGLIPIINFPYIYSRDGGSIKSPEDFQKILNLFHDFVEDESYYLPFSGIADNESGELYRVPIRKNEPKFEHLASCLVDNKNNYNATLISSSPVLEYDAAYMRLMIDRIKDESQGD